MGDFFHWVFAIPIIAIVLGVGSEMWKNFLKHQERKVELMAANQSSVNGAVQQQIDALREEVARLRDTSTQYDISIQSTLEDMQHRVAYLENKARPARASEVAAGTDEPARIARS